MSTDASTPFVDADEPTSAECDHVLARVHEFLAALPLTHDDGTYLFVHAGIRPGVALELQAEHDLLWIRHEFLDHEVDTATGDEIRAHLTECEPCLDRFDVEQAVKSLVKRCCGGEKAPDRLRVSIMSSITVTRRSL